MLWWPTTIEFFSLLLHACNFATATIYNIILEIEVFQKGHDPQVESLWASPLSPQLQELLYALLAEPGETLCYKVIFMQENCGDIVSSYRLLPNEFTFLHLRAFARSYYQLTFLIIPEQSVNFLFTYSNLLTSVPFSCFWPVGKFNWVCLPFLDSLFNSGLSPSPSLTIPPLHQSFSIPFPCIKSLNLTK